MKNVECQWYKPICTEVLAAFNKVYMNYEAGVPYATRAYISTDITYEDKITIYAHKIALKPKHAEHLHRILSTIIPQKQVTSDIKVVCDNVKNGRLLPGGFYLIEICFYKNDIKLIVETLNSVRTGSYKKAQIADLITEDKEKAPFEL